jgi:hypothetical protein
VYSIVEKQDRPILISTSRHIRQMAFDIRQLTWEGSRKRLSGVSRAVSGDPYQLRVWMPEGYRAGAVELSGGLRVASASEGPLLTVDYTPAADGDVAWSIDFNVSG